MAWACCRACSAERSGGDACLRPERCGKMFASGSHDSDIRIYAYQHAEWDDFAQLRAAQFANTQSCRDELNLLKRKHDLICRNHRRVKRARDKAEDALEAARALQREMQEEDELLADEEAALAEAEAAEQAGAAQVDMSVQALQDAEDALQVRTRVRLSRERQREGY